MLSRWVKQEDSFSFDRQDSDGDMENGLAERHPGNILLLGQWSWMKNVAGRVGKEEWVKSDFGSDWLWGDQRGGEKAKRK